MFYENSGDSPGMTRHLLLLLLLRRCRRWSLQTQHWAESPPPRLLRRRPLPRCSWAAAENGDEKDGGSPSSSQKSAFLFLLCGNPLLPPSPPPPTPPPLLLRPFCLRNHLLRLIPSTIFSSVSFLTYPHFKWTLMMMIVVSESRKWGRRCSSLSFPSLPRSSGSPFPPFSSLTH